MGQVLETVQSVRAKREEIQKIAAKHGAQNVRVFGSVARGESRSGSDLDLLIETGPKVTSWFPGGLVYDLEALLGCRVDVVTETGLHPPLRESVLKDARSL